jgi:hypothetical protein
LEGEPPSEVEVIVLPVPSDPADRGHTGGKAVLLNASAIIGLALVITAASAIVATVSLGGRGGAPRAGAREPAEVVPSYRAMRRCSMVTISQSDPAYARLELGHTRPCWRHAVSVDAIFHRVDGTWRPVLDASSYSCPVTSLPAAVQADLAICVHTDRPVGAL